MKQFAWLITVLAFAILCVSCQQGPTDNLEKKIVELENKVAEQEEALKKRDDDVSTLSAVIYSSAIADVFGSPLDNFFAAPEFWENTYDVDPSAPCHTNCSKVYAAAVENCQSISDLDQRLACVNTAYENLRNCTRRCRPQ
jgi:hypothetical protein